MPNTLTFARVYKSITSLDAVTLPNFVVLTGVNGSGKTHLLTAIKGGQVVSSLVSDQANDVRLFDHSNIVPTDTGPFDPAQDQTRRSQWFQALNNLRDQQFPSLQQAVMALGVPAHICSTISRIDALTVPLLTSILNSSDLALSAHTQIRQHLRNLGQAVGQNSINNIGDEQWRKAAPKLIHTAPERFFVASRTDFFKDQHFLWGDIDPFQQAFGQVFATYRTLVHDNDRLEKYPPLDEPTKTFLTKQEFINEFGVPPWLFVNRILEESNLDFRVDSPLMHETASYEPKLRKISRDIEMKFQDLSSGEKVLMSFALCIYNSQEGRQAKTFPKLLLLDEVDAPLHPSMAVSLINTIQNVLVRDKNISVILTTHSPSTVALAPEAAIYSMNPAGPRVEKMSKGGALALLTTGVPTLSISFSGRRQVFVESRTDASLFDMLYQKYKYKLNSERSLAFIEVGRTNQNGLEQAGGCEQVTRLVDALTSRGNESVFGLVDWDGKNTRNGRVHVLSAGLRNGLETAMFDPLLMIALLAHENISELRALRLLDVNETYQSLSTWSTSRWRTAVDAFQDIVLGSASPQEEKREIRYISGISVLTRNAYLAMDDHALEKLLLSRFQFLRAKSRHAGDLMQLMIDTVLSDFQDFLPSDVLLTMNELLEGS